MKKMTRGASKFVYSAVISLIAAVLVLAGPLPSRCARRPYRVALFDFDRREVTPDPLARHIESKLQDRMPHIVVDHYSGLGDESRSVRLLQAIDNKGYHLVITRTSDALIIAQHTLFKTPTLYTNANNPLLLGFKTLGPPGGNISGASYYIPVEKHLRVYKAIWPTLKKPGFLFDKHNKSRRVEVPETRSACTALGLPFEMEFVESRDQLPQAAKRLIDRGVDAVVAASSGTIYENIHTFIEDANRKGVPVFSFYKMGVWEGAAVALSSDYFQIADELLLPMAERVLTEGVSCGSMPAAFLEKNSLFVNRSQVRRFKLHIPQELKKEHNIIFVE